MCGSHSRAGGNPSGAVCIPSTDPVHAGQWLCIQDFFDPADDAALQAHLDAVRVQARICEDVPDDAFGQPARTLILLLDDLDTGPHSDLCAIGSLHACTCRLSSSSRLSS